jgi:hypothetical protein
MLSFQRCIGYIPYIDLFFLCLFCICVLTIVFVCVADLWIFYVKPFVCVVLIECIDSSVFGRCMSLCVFFDDLCSRLCFVMCILCMGLCTVFAVFLIGWSIAVVFLDVSLSVLLIYVFVWVVCAGGLLVGLIEVTEIDVSATSVFCLVW